MAANWTPQVTQIGCMAYRIARFAAPRPPALASSLMLGPHKAAQSVHHSTPGLLQKRGRSSGCRLCEPIRLRPGHGALLGLVSAMIIDSPGFLRAFGSFGMSPAVIRVEAMVRSGFLRFRGPAKLIRDRGKDLLCDEMEIAHRVA
jgi:hypothetical protein